MKGLLSNTPLFYVVDSDIHLNSTHKTFPLQQWLRKHAMMLRYTNIV